MSMADSFNEMEPKQKVTLLVTIVLFAFMAYLAYDTFFAGDSVSAPAPKVSAAPTPAPKSASATTASSASTQVRTFQPAQPVQPQQTEAQKANIQQIPKAEPTPEERALIAKSQEIQGQYLELVNQYQLKQMQQKLDAADAAIAASVLQTATTRLQTQQLQEQMKDQKSGPSITSADNTTDGKPAAAPISNIEVSYVGQKRGNWMAMLNLDGNFFEVRMGTQLPDGAVVDLINEKGVVLEKNSEKKYFRVPRSLD